MVFAKNWDEFEISAEGLYMQAPAKCRFTMKYHSKGYLVLKMTNNQKCVQYKTEVLPDLKKVERFTGNLMNHMSSNE